MPLVRSQGLVHDAGSRSPHLFALLRQPLQTQTRDGFVMCFSFGFSFDPVSSDHLQLAQCVESAAATIRASQNVKDVYFSIDDCGGHRGVVVCPSRGALMECGQALVRAVVGGHSKFVWKLGFGYGPYVGAITIGSGMASGERRWVPAVPRDAVLPVRCSDC